MIEPTIPTNEIERLNALCSLEVLDTESEARYDRITRVAKNYFQVPIVLVSLVDSQRQWFKSIQGLEATETPRNISFCGHAILSNEIFYIPNALEDERFYDNPLVTGAPNIRFYAGAPLILPEGERVGTLCIIDQKPRELTAQDFLVLRDLADMVGAELVHGYLLKVQVAGSNESEPLRDFAKRLSLATRAGGIGVWEYDILNNKLTWDERMFQLYGVNKESFPGAYEAWRQALHPDDVERCEYEFSQAVAGNGTFDTEFRVVWPNDEVHHIKASAAVLRNEAGDAQKVIGVNQDITLQKKMAMSAKLSELIIQSSDDAIISKDLEGRVTSWNRGAEKIFHYSAQEMIGSLMLKLYPEDRFDEEGHILQSVARGETVEHFETVRLSKEKQLIDISATISPVEDEYGEIVGASVIARDISQKKKLEEIKSQFVSTVSHELRTPLTSIRGALALVLGKLKEELPVKMLNLLEIALRNSERLTLLINDILDLEKLQSENLEFDKHLIDLVKVVQQALEDNNAYAAKHKVTLEFQSNLTDAWVEADEHRLLQVLANLISNACKFSIEQSQVIISLDVFEDRFRVTVRDFGKGIPDEFRNKIFERFSQVDSSDRRAVGGTGLGLSISKVIIDHHDGILDYTSELGKGSAFYFELPRLSKEKGFLSAGAVPSNKKTSKPEFESSDAVKDGCNNIPRVLLCEDNPDTALVISEMVSMMGVECDIAYTAGEALQRLSKTDYQLLLLDLGLPDMPGIQLIEKLRSDPKTRRLPIIIVSGNPDCGQAKYLQVAEWLHKPVDPARLEIAVREAFSSSGKPQILQVEDDQDIVNVCSSLLSEIAELTSVPSIHEARKLLAESTFDLVILDLTLKDGSGIELLQSLKGLCPVIIFSAQQASNQLEAQVNAALTKSMASNVELVETIKNLLQERKPI